MARWMPLLCMPALILSAQEAPPAAFEAILAPHYKADAPGAAVLVVKGEKVLFKQGFGLANVELGVPIQPDMVFRIGSVTKQFTGAAVLLLVEDGKVDLQRPLRHYLPELPEAWGKATVEQVLNHTAGIPDWVETPEFMKHMREDQSPAQLVAHDKGKPLEFEPGTKWAYSNVGYLALGLLIEKASGQGYYDFLAARLLKPLGLNHTGFGDEKVLIRGMVGGYTEGPQPAPYLSMMQPAAAGALVSTVEDLAKWTLALHGGKVLKPESYARMVRSYPMAGGGETHYGFGLGIRESQGRRLLWHNGGINGFTCILEADPEARAVAVILNNSDARTIDDRYLSRRLLGLAIGRPVTEPKPVALSADQLQRLAGRYQGPKGGARTILFEAGRLITKGGDGKKRVLEPLSETECFLPGTDARFRFILEGGKATGLHRSDVGEAEGNLLKRTEAPNRTPVPMEPAAFEAFVGAYELAPGFVIKVWREGPRFFAQATGQAVMEIFAEGPSTFFLKAPEAQLVFQKDAQGAVSGLTLNQGGRSMAARRLK